MSAAPQHPPVVFIPPRARPRTVGAPLYGAPNSGSRRLRLVAHEPVEPNAPVFDAQAAPSARPIHLTHRGLVVILGLATVLVAAVLLIVARLSAPTHSVTGSSGTASVVDVQAGDSLWTIAVRIAPQRDPRAVIRTLETVNHLSADAVLQPGQQLRTR
jgi:LysM repeat protein